MIGSSSTFQVSLADIERYGARLYPGVRVVLNVQEEFEVEAVLEFDAARKIWLGSPDWAYTA